MSLEVHPNDHVLDLCCAPGGKLLLIADSLQKNGPPSKKSFGTITGVDISQKRISICQSLIKKSNSMAKIRVRLFATDGTTFKVPPPDENWWDFNHLKKNPPSKPNGLQEPKISKTESSVLKPFFSSKLLRNISTPNSLANKKYSKVLVDAECSHDGSLIHLEKYINTSSGSFAKLDDEFLTYDRLKNVSDLQYKLILNGWNNLCVDGTLIYSTCSLSYKQNELVIAKFMEKIIMDHNSE
ncbi:tRNA (cytosine(34)-C(5))-methyltransferase [Smittium mucronatum]|nr:tRNA (cytosine(34)-C(5))-methyltransferase [Smittium mucronatum]